MRVGIIFSAFDLLHAGHVVMLAEAKTKCDYLIAGLHVDPTIENQGKNKPVQSVTERMIQLQAVKYVDQVIVYSTEQDLLDILCLYPVDIRFLGEDYKGEPYTGQGFIPVEYLRRKHGFSTTELRKRIQRENI